MLLFSDQEEVLIFMEYCPGGTMHDIAKQGPPESSVRVWTLQLLQAVQVLHDKKIVHGDIKGTNIFVSDNGVKLGDFGCSAKLADVAGTGRGEPIEMRGTVGKCLWLLCQLTSTVLTLFRSMTFSGQGKASFCWVVFISFHTGYTC